MTEFPRKVEGGRNTTELITGIFWSANAGSPEAAHEGERLHHDDFRLAARDADIDPINASRAFNEVYTRIRQHAREQGLIGIPTRERTPSWEYRPDFDPNGYYYTWRRDYILLGTQAVHDTYQKVTASLHVRERRAPTRWLLVVEEVLGLGDLRRFEEEQERLFRAQHQARHNIEQI